MTNRKTIGYAFAAFALVLVCFAAVFSKSSSSSRRSLWWGGLDITGASCSTCFKEDKLNIGPVSVGFSWKEGSRKVLLPQIIPGSPLLQGEVAAQAEKISRGDRIRGAITGGAMGFYDFGMQGAVGGAVGGWFGRRSLQSCVHGRDSRGWSWLRCKEATSSSYNTFTNDELDVQAQWIGAVMRTAAQGGPISSKILSMNSDMEKMWSWEGAARGAAQGAVTGGFSGAVGGPAGVAWGAGLGAVGGAIAGGTGWGRQLKDTEKRDLSGSFNVNGGWSEGQGFNVNAGLKFTWKETENLESALLNEVISYTNNAIKYVTQQGGERLSDLLDVFSDDLRAASAGLRTLADQTKRAMAAPAERREKNMWVPIPTMRWKDVLDGAQSVFNLTPTSQHWSNALLSNAPEDAEKLGPWLHRASQGNARDVRSIMPGWGGGR